MQGENPALTIAPPSDPVALLDQCRVSQVGSTRIIFMAVREEKTPPSQSIAQLNQVAISDQRLHAGCLQLGSMAITHIAGGHCKFS